MLTVSILSVLVIIHTHCYINEIKLPNSYICMALLYIYSTKSGFYILVTARVIPDSIPPSDRRWLLVALSADFADVGPTLACQPTLWLDVSIFCRRWANVGPTLACQPTLRLDVYILPMLGQRWANGGFLFKIVASNNRGFGVT